MRKAAYLPLITALTGIAQAVLPALADPAADAVDAQIWARFAKPEQNLGASDRGGNSPAITGSLITQPATAQQGNFFVPGMATPVYQSALELIRQAAPGDFNFTPGMYRTPGWSMGLGGGGLSNIPMGSSLPSLAASAIMGGLGMGGIGMGGIPYVGSLSPGAFSAAGAFYPGLGQCNIFGCGWKPNTMGLGNMGRPAFYQLEPSKPAGNYYQPPTYDSTAAGNYYTGAGNAYVPVIQNQPEPQDYWGPQGNPFADAINKPVPK